MYLTMRKLLLMVFTCFTFGAATAQDSSYRHQLGINATLFVKQYLTFNSSTVVNASPYLLTYKNINNGKGLRAGLGYNSSSSNRNPNNGSPLVETNTMNVDFRIGYEWQHKLSRHWLYYVGVDAIYDYDLSRTKSSSTSGFPPQTVEITTASEGFGAGGGAVLGLEFRLGKRISLNTETTAYMRYSESRNSQNNPQFPQFNTSDFTARNSFSIILPTSIFFVVHF